MLRRSLLVGVGGVTGGLWVLDKASSRRPRSELERKLTEGGYSESALDEDGVTILEGALSREQIAAFKSFSCFQDTVRFLDLSPQSSDARSQHQHPIEQKYLSQDQEAKWRRERHARAAKGLRENRESTSGRYHRVSFSRDELEALAAFEANWMEKVHAYMGVQDSSEIYRSQLQLLVSCPGSVNQFFHQDNARKGVTLIIPLEDVTMEMGPTQLLPGSHKLSEAGAPSTETGWLGTFASFKSVFHHLCQKLPVRASVGAGTAIVYDGRVLHRGLANNSEVPRPVLVYRYDPVAYPPPQAGVARTAFMRFVGYALNGLCHARSTWF